MSRSEFGAGYKTALEDIHSYLMNTYQSAFTWDDINEALQELGFVRGEHE